MIKKLIIILIALLISGEGWGATLADSQNWKYSKKITLSGTGADETNYIVRLNLHHGTLVGDATSYDVFLDGHSQTDFSDVRFTDSSGNLLAHYRAGYGNYEIITDSRLGNRNWIHSDGTIIASGVAGQAYIKKSANNGVNWTTLDNTANSKLIFVDSRGYAYNAAGYKLRRSVDWNTSNNWTEVLDMTSASGVGLTSNIAEDTSGNLYLGRYQESSAPVIYKSTDGGANWVDVFSASSLPARARNTTYAAGAIVRPTTANDHIYVCTVAGTTEDADDDGSHPVWPTTSGTTVTDGGVTWKESYIQHSHMVAVDPYTNYIYAAFDGNITYLTKSMDGGSTWVVLGSSGYGWDVVKAIFEPTARFFAGGYTAKNTGTGILATSNDTSFTKSLGKNASVQGLLKFGSSYYGAVVNIGPACYPQIVRSIDSGATWQTVWTSPFINEEGFAGPTFLLNSGIPTGETETQILVGPVNSGTSSYSPMRIYDGGSHYQSTFYVKIPTLAAAGKDIYVWYGNSAATTASSKTIFGSTVASDIVHRYLLNEGTGTAVSDSVGSAHGTLSGTGGAWTASDGRSVGDWVPSFSNSASSYTFGESSLLALDNPTTASDTTFNAAANFSAVAWVKLNTTTISGTRPIIGKGHASSSKYYVLGVINGGKLSYEIKNSSGTSNIYRLNSENSEIFISDLKWHQVGFVVSADGKVTYILDGILGEEQDPTYKYEWETVYNVRIGNKSGGTSPFPGQISDVQIYNKKLSALEVQQLFEDRPVAATDSVRTADADDLLVFASNSYKVCPGSCTVVTDSIDVDNFTVLGGINANATFNLNNTISYDSDGADITIAAGKTVTGDYNWFQDAGKAGDGTYTDGGNTTWSAADPLFKSATDYSLTGASPCINAGSNAVWYGTASVTSYNGLGITNAAGAIIAPGGTVDIGAYEYRPSINNAARFLLLFD